MYIYGDSFIGFHLIIFIYIYIFVARSEIPFSSKIDRLILCDKLLRQARHVVFVMQSLKINNKIESDHLTIV